MKVSTCEYVYEDEEYPYITRRKTTLFYWFKMKRGRVEDNDLPT